MNEQRFEELLEMSAADREGLGAEERAWLESADAQAEALRALPEMEPTLNWGDIEAAAAGEKESPSNPWQWVATAACAGLVAVLVINVGGNAPELQPGKPVAAVTTGAMPATELALLSQRTAEQEQVLRDVGRQRWAMPVDTASSVTRIQNRVAMIDYRLSREALSRDEATLLWEQRVALMDELIRLRATGTPVAAF